MVWGGGIPLPSRLGDVEVDPDGGVYAAHPVEERRKLLQRVRGGATENEFWCIELKRLCNFFHSISKRQFTVARL